MSASPAMRLLELPRRERASKLRTYGEDELRALMRDWRFWARPEQLAPPGWWSVWAVVTGRGYGKTRTGAEWCLDRCELFARAGAAHRGALVGRTVADTRDVMVEGESGLVACAERRGHGVKYEPSKRLVRLPDLDSSFLTFTAEKPDQLRGPQFHTAWGDEAAAWKLIADREGNTAWSNLMLALRLEGSPDVWWDDDEGDFVIAPPDPELEPRCIVTTTPKPIPLVRDWISRATAADASIVLTTGSMLDNRVNLAGRFVREILARYSGTRLGAQEIDGVYLEGAEGALWEPETIEQWRVRRLDDVPDLGEVVIGVDPSGSTTGDECGIVVCGVERNPVDWLRRHVYVLEDLSVQNRPEVWARVVVNAYWRWLAKADAVRVVAEVNFGAALVTDVIHLTDPNVIVDEVRASRGKRPRAEPVSLLYQQGRAHHVGYFGLMEAQMCNWVPDDDDSPDRMDAAVWAVSALVPELLTQPASTTSAADRRLPTGAAAAARTSGGGGSPFAGLVDG